VAEAPAVTTVTPDGRVMPEGMETPEGRVIVTAEVRERRVARAARVVFIFIGSGLLKLKGGLRGTMKI
jgi:hypothetical protein